jgi:uncharacterized protein (TIGR00661 family)
MRKLRVAFVVQGEGRGHMTQALALRAFLADAGHQVERVLLGRSPHRSTPKYFAAAFDAPVRSFHAPTQIPGRDRQALSVGRTALDALRRSPDFIKSVIDIAEETRGVDVVVNFLDLMGALARLIRSEVPAIAVAHNYIFLHPELDSAPGPAHVKRFVLAYARATASGSGRKVALSFEPHASRPASGLVVAPPLLRPGLDALAASDDGYLLAYALNAGYASDLIRWQRRNPAVEVHCYLDGGTAALSESVDPGFHAHGLAEGPFLKHLAGCRAYVGSAGFESICEAHYLGKPVLAVPTEGHFEQTLNAWDAERSGAARAGTYEDLDDFWINEPAPEAGAVERFRSWVDQAPELLVQAVERAATGGQA